MWCTILGSPIFRNPHLGFEINPYLRELSFKALNPPKLKTVKPSEHMEAALQFTTGYLKP